MDRAGAGGHHRRQRRRQDSSSSSDDDGARVVNEHVHARVALAPNTNQDPSLMSMSEQDRKIRKLLKKSGRVHEDERRTFVVPEYLLRQRAELQPIYRGICTLVNKNAIWRRRYLALALDLPAKKLSTSKEALSILGFIEDCNAEIERHQDKVEALHGPYYAMPPVFSRDLKLMD